LVNRIRRCNNIRAINHLPKACPSKSWKLPYYCRIVPFDILSHYHRITQYLIYRHSIVFVIVIVKNVPQDGALNPARLFIVWVGLFKCVLYLSLITNKIFVSVEYNFITGFYINWIQYIKNLLIDTFSISLSKNT
jgi:hypothetical protein